jgi:acid phosphatase type 7
MRTTYLSLPLALLACACSSSHNTSTQADSGTTTQDGGEVEPFTYTPAGCMYSVDPPASWGLQNEALDTPGPVDPTMGVPQRVRLGMGGSTTVGPGYPDITTTASFTWETAQANQAAEVKLATSPSAVASGTTYTGWVWTTPPPSAGDFGSTDPAVNMHEVHVCGLKPATTYYYQVGGGATGQQVWSATQSFTTLPTSGSITIGMLGDARDEVSVWQLVNQRMLSLNVAAIVFSGDLILWGTEEDLYSQWLDATWKNPNNASEFLTLGQLMFLPVPGNHEDEAVQYYSNFSTPGDGPYAKSYYSFNLGSVHFVMIDDELIGTETGEPEPTAQLAWIQQDLTAANMDRANHPFIVAVEHRGVYTTSTHASDPDVLQARASLVPLYDMTNVDLVFAGHDHEYERTYPVREGNPISGNPVVEAAGKGTIYVTCAGAGADPYPVNAGSYPFRYDYAEFCQSGAMSTCTAPTMDKSYVGVYATLNIDGNTLTFKAYGLKGAGGADDVIETFTLSH